MTFPTLAFSERYDGDGRRLVFQIRPSAKQVMREALKRDAALERASSRSPRRAAIPLLLASIRLSAPSSSIVSASPK
jgi:hypothetical protein